MRNLWLQKAFVALLWLSLSGGLGLEQAVAQEGRVVLRLSIERADGSPYSGTAWVQAVEAKDAIEISINQYGLGFGHLLPEMRYMVSVAGFANFSSFTTPAAEEGECSVDIVLPEATLEGKTASEGKGLVIFTYLDATGAPRAGERLYVQSEDGASYEGVTDQHGVARVEVPLDAYYTMSVRGYPDFSSHRFQASPAFQTAEIRLAESEQRPIKSGSAPRRERPRKAPGAKKMQHHDSVDAARAKIKGSLKRHSPQVVALPPRGTKPSPTVSKQVLNGVCLLRQAVVETERTDPQFRTTTHLELLRQLLRHNRRNSVFVVDVTCSMDAYVEEYLLWLVLQHNARKIRGCVFFNDGDGCPDMAKIAGQTGGIRACGNSLRQIADTLVASIAYGCSGDEAENDIEALLHAQALYPDAKELLLVADNNSAVRDMALLDSLKVPIRVFLCGRREGSTPLPPHEDYVTIAYRTGGSLHTMEDDIPLEGSAMHNQIMEVLGWQYRYVKGRFVRETL